MARVILLLHLLALPLRALGTAVGTGGANSTSHIGQNATTNVFHTDEFFNALVNPCKRFSDRLEACPSNALEASRDRFETVQLFAECFAHQYGDYFVCSKPFEKLKFLPVQAFPAMYNTKNYTDVSWKNATLPDFPTQGSCQRPDVISIMKKACAFDYGILNGSDCCSSPKSTEPCGRESFNLLACSIQSLHTYVGCTAREQDPDVEKCVADTAPRINFVPIGFQVNSNGNACPNARQTITALARWSVIEWLAFLLFGNVPFLTRLVKRQVFGQKGEDLRSKTFKINMLGFWASLGIDIGEIVIVGTLLSKAGYQVDIFKEFVIWSVRPRSAFWNGLLGAIDGGWTHEAITDMMAHILLSIFGGYLAFFGALSANHTTNPARPFFWKTYMVGGFMASVSTDVVWLSFSLLCILATCCCWKAIGPPFKLIFRVIWFGISSPFAQAKVFVKNLYFRIRGQKGRREEYLVKMLGEQPLMAYYYGALAVCFVLFLGNWMFWTGFLELSGELYCPGQLWDLDLIVIGLIFARNLLRQIFLHL